MNWPGRKQTIISAAFFLLSLYLVYLTYYNQLRIAWDPTPLSALYIGAMIVLAVLPTFAFIVTRRPSEGVVSLSVIVSFLMSFVGTFAYFIYLYMIYVIDLSLIYGKEVFGSREQHRSQLQG